MKNLIYALMFLSLSAHARDWYNVDCSADSTRQMGAVYHTDAKLAFTYYIDATENSVADLGGYVFVGPEASADEEISEDNSYKGYFTIEKLVSNPKYRPIKYKEYVQFQNVNAAVTRGSESGMWGELLVPKAIEVGTETTVKYIFKAGDHMGGTIDFSCKVTR